MSRGVWVAGPSRSGTSMVAGLLAAHGVYFGTCRRPNDDNPKGFFENVWLKEVLRGRYQPKFWPGEWWDALRDQGWDGTTTWGVKCGPERASLIMPMRPSVIVVTKRPASQIKRSRERTTWATGNADRAIERSYEAVESMRRRAFRLQIPIIEVRTDRLVAGYWGQMYPVMTLLGDVLDHDKTKAWIDPTLWGRPAQMEAEPDE